MKSITDATWKDAAIIEARSLLARLEGIAGAASSAARFDQPTTVKQIDLESVTRQAAKLAELIDKIEEKPRRVRKAVARG